MSEFCLSSKRKLDNEVPRCFYWEEDIKKFIRLLNIKAREYEWEGSEIINELAGKELI